MFFLDSILLRFSACLFFRISFSRIFLRFTESCVSQKKKGFIPSPLPLTPKKIKRRFSFSAIKGRASLFPLLAQSLRRALLPPCSNDCAPRSGREAVCTCVLHILFDFCSAKMAESKDFTLDSARFVLSHPLFESGKALLGLCGVVDSVSVLDSESICESRAWLAAEILELCVRFKCCARRGEGVTLSVMTDAEPPHSFKDCVQAKFPLLSSNCPPPKCTYKPA